MPESLRQLLSDPAVMRAAIVVAALIAVALGTRLLVRAVAGRVEDVDARYRARKIVTLIGYVTAAAILVGAYSSRVSGFTVALGVAGAGIAFALQEVIASIAGWVALTFSRWYSAGDRIQLGGIRGDVIDIGVLRTTMLECGQWVDGDLYNGRIVRIANSFVFKEPVFNYSGDFPFLWDEIKVPVRYDSDRALARTILQRAATRVSGAFAEEAARHWDAMLRKYRIEAATVEPFVTSFLTENWLQFTVRYVVDYRRRRATKDQLTMAILDEFDRTDGRVRLAAASLEIVSMTRTPGTP